MEETVKNKKLKDLGLSLMTSVPIISFFLGIMISILNVYAGIVFMIVVLIVSIMGACLYCKGTDTRVINYINKISLMVLVVGLVMVTGRIGIEGSYSRHTSHCSLAFSCDNEHVHNGMVTCYYLPDDSNTAEQIECPSSSNE